MAHIKIHEELVEFAGKVPEKVAEPVTFVGDSLFGTMVGIRMAAAAHAGLLTKMEQLVTAADSGMQAYKQAAHTIDANYTGTDALNAAEQQQLASVAADASSVIQANTATTSQDVVAPGMATPADLAPERQPSYWWNDYDALPNTMPGIGAAPVPEPKPAGTQLPPAPPAVPPR